MTLLVQWIDRTILPASLRTGDGDALRRARLLVVMTALLLGVNVSFDLWFLLSGDFVGGVPSVLLGAFYLSGLVVVHRRGDLALATHLICGPLILLILGQVYIGGGILAVGTWCWAIFGVMVAYLLGGVRTGRVWAIVHFAAVGLAILQLVGGWHETEVTTYVAAMSSLSVLFLSVLLLGVVAVYERLKDHMVASLREASQRSRLVLDNIGDGFLLVRPDGTLTAERSLAAEHWFGPAAPDVRVWDYLVEGELDQLRMMLGWEEIVADIMPRELLLAQMPKRTTRGARTFSLQYCVVGDGRIEAIVVVVRDVTLALAGLRAEEERQEQMQLFELVARDPDAFRAFLREARMIVESLRTTTDAVQHRMLHTLKGNAGQLGARTLASMCHQIEEKVAAGDEIGPEDIAELNRRIDGIARRFASLLVEDVGHLQLDVGDVAALRDAIHRGADGAELESLVDGWTGESMSQRLGRMADQARALGSRLGRGEIEVQVALPPLRFPRGRLDELFASFSHLVRNAVDHGIEPRDERIRAGKPPVGALRLTAALTDDTVVFTVADDGRGVDWDRVRERAMARGLPVGTAAEVADALFVDGLTTRDAVDEISGRGIGMSAVRQAAVRLGGTIRVESTPGSGTVVTVEAPYAAVFGTTRQVGKPQLVLVG